MTTPDLYVGVEPVWFEYNGESVLITPATVVRSGHAIMDGRSDLFTPLVVTYEVEGQSLAPQAAAAPAAKREPRTSTS